MTSADISSFLFAFADALAVPHNIAVLAFALICLWALYKWGAPILLLYAVFYFWIGRCSDGWGTFLLAFALTFVRSGIQFLDRLTWSRTRDRPA